MQLFSLACLLFSCLFACTALYSKQEQAREAKSVVGLQSREELPRLKCKVDKVRQAPVCIQA